LGCLGNGPGILKGRNCRREDCYLESIQMEKRESLGGKHFGIKGKIADELTKAKGRGGEKMSRGKIIPMHKMLGRR